MDRDTTRRGKTGRNRRRRKSKAGASELTGQFKPAEGLPTPPVTTAIVPAKPAAPGATAIKPAREPAATVQLGERLLAADDHVAAARVFLAVRARRPADSRAACGLARAQAALGNRRLAAATLRAHLARVPTDAAAWWQLAEVFSAPSERHEAMSALERVVVLDPGRADAHLWMARIAWGLGNGDVARRRVRECLHLAPRNAEAHYLLGVIYEKWGRLGDALRELRLARELESDADDLAGRIGTLSESLSHDKQTLARLTQETASGPGDPKKLYDLTKYQVRAGELSAALDICDRVLLGNPQAGEFLELRARILVEDDRPEEGLVAAEEASEAAGDRSIAHLYQRRVENRFGPPAERRRFYESLIRRNPQRLETYLNLGLLQASGTGPGFGTTAALYSFAEGLKLNPEHAGLHLARGDALAAAGRWTEALESYRAAVNEEPNNPRLHDRCGIAHMRRGDLDSARRDFRRALDLQGQFDKPHFHLAQAAEAAGDLDAAVAGYRQALRFNRRHSEARLCLAAALRRQGRSEEAEEFCRQVLSEHPDSPAALCTLAGLADLRGRADEAERLYRRALSVPADTPPACTGFRADVLARDFGLHLARRGRQAEALEYLSAAREARPDDAAINEQFAALLLEMGRAAAATRPLRIALAAEPDRVTARLLLARALRESGKPAAGAREAKAAIKVVPGSGAAWHQLGECRAAVGDYVDAVRCFRNALEHDPRHPGAIDGLLSASRRPRAGIAADERRRWLVRSLANAADERTLERRLAELEK